MPATALTTNSRRRAFTGALAAAPRAAGTSETLLDPIGRRVPAGVAPAPRVGRILIPPLQNSLLAGKKQGIF
jgi:hypothetical protein